LALAEAEHRRRPDHKPAFSGIPQERDAPSVGRPGGPELAPAGAAETLRPVGGQVLDVDGFLLISRAPPAERDRPAVRAEGRVGGRLLRPAAGGVQFLRQVEAVEQRHAGTEERRGG
jgi:hypothetical protein